MSDITCFGTRAPEDIVAFYVEWLGATTWLEQPDCPVLKFDNQLLGFCEREAAEIAGTITIVVEDHVAVDGLHEELTDVAREPPRVNERYEIYQFFADDPEGRTVDVQTFLHPTPSV